jgi:hypothetical protein
MKHLTRHLGVILGILIPIAACAAQPVGSGGPPRGPGPLNAGQHPLNAGQQPLNAAATVAATGAQCFVMTEDPTMLTQGQPHEREAGPISCAQCEQLIAKGGAKMHSCDENQNCSDIAVSQRCVPVGSIPTSSSGGN